MSLRDILCQEKAIDSLQSSMNSGKLAQAFIFAGPDGVGRYLTAVEWAKMLLCKDTQQIPADNGRIFFDSCGQCASCRLFESEGHPDFQHIYKELVKFTKDGKNKTTPIDMPKDVIQEFLIDKVAGKPQMCDKVIYVVDESEKLNAASQNALLKTLEEPPSHCIIILLCSKLEKLLPTTLSRCQTIRFGPVSEEQIIARLSKSGISADQGRFWARFTEGSLGQSETWASLEVGQTNCYEIKKELVSRICNLRLADSLNIAEWIVGQSKLITKAWESISENTSKSDLTRRVNKGLVRMIMTAVSDTMKLGLGLEEDLTNFDQAGDIERLAAIADPETCGRMIQKAFENIRWVDSSVNEKLIFEELLLNYADSVKMRV